MISDEARTVATEKAAEPSAVPRLLSSDGCWWYNGRRWVPAVTEEGLWRWDGSRWVPTVDLVGKRPEDLALTLAGLAEDRYAGAGALLTESVREWKPQASLREMTEQAQVIHRQIKRLEEEVNVPEGRSLLGGRRTGTEDRRTLQDQLQQLRRDHRSLTVRIGRGAPQPSTKEADDALATARLLDERSAMLTGGLAEVDEAERMRADAAVAAQKELSIAEDARLKALERARRAVEAAEASHAAAVAEARTRLSAVLSPGAGELKAGLGPLRLHDNLLETTGARLPTAGLAAFADSAPALWRAHREQLSDLLVLEGSEAEGFREALAHRSDALFLLITSPRGATLLACPQGQEKVTRRFASRVTEHADEAARSRDQRLAEARQAEDALDAVIRDRTSIDAAETELARADADPGLLGAIDEARQRLNRARADTPELIEARRKLLEVARRLTSPPEPLRTVNQPGPA